MVRAIKNRIDAVDWSELGEAMDRDGYAVLPALVEPEECGQLIRAYEDESLFRSRVVMSRFGFGRGEYKYFKYPLPEIVAELRQHAYAKLAPMANRWAASIGGGGYPGKHGEFLEVCHAAGQDKPTPLVLKYEAGDYNCLHQDLYGAVAFPLQMTFFLSRRDVDYSGGEFVLVEQRPRMQSRARVITAEQGQAVIFPTRYRAVAGTRGMYRTNLRHGVSPLRWGRRFALGIIFHDAQ